MDAAHVYALLREACHLLDGNEEHAIAALVGQSMAMLARRYSLPEDRQDDD